MNSRSNKENVVMKEILTYVCGFLSVVFKIVARIVLSILKLALAMLQVLLLLFSLIIRIFFAFVRVGTV